MPSIIDTHPDREKIINAESMGKAIAFTLRVLYAISKNSAEPWVRNAALTALDEMGKAVGK